MLVGSSDMKWPDTDGQHVVIDTVFGVDKVNQNDWYTDI